jgi:PAS domain S-box-containing protein
LLHVLLVDDEMDLAEVAKAFLEKLQPMQVEIASSAEQALARLQDSHFDAVISDYQMPKMNGIELLRVIRAGNDPIAFILFTGKGRESVVIEALNSGADGYMQKGGDPSSTFTELAHKTLAAVRRYQAEQAHRESEERFRSLSENAFEGIVISIEGVIVDVNSMFTTLMQYKPQEVIGTDIFRYFVPDSVGTVKERLKLDFTGAYEVQAVRKDGAVITLEIKGKDITWQGRAARLGAVLDITDRKKGERVFARLNQCLASLGPDFRENVNSIVATGGELLHASFAMYSRVREGSLLVQASWNTPADLPRVLPVDSSLCGDVLRHDRDQIILDDAQLAALAGNRPMITAYGVHAYAGQVVRLRGAVIGTLCFVFRYPARPSELDQRLIGTLAIAIASEEQRCREQAELQESEAHMKALMSATPDPIFMKDRQSRWIMVNPALLQLFGMTNEEVRGKNDIEIFHGTPEARVLVASDERVMSNDRAEVFEERVPTKEGMRIYLSTKSPFHDASGKVIGLVGVARDITERKSAEQELLESEQRFHQMAEQNRTIVWEVDVNGLYTFVSATAEGIIGYRPEELVGKRHFYELHPFEGRAAFREAAFRVFEQRQEFKELVNPVQTKSGDIIWATTNGIPVLNDGVLTGYRGSDMDITARRQAEESLLQANRKLNLLSSITRHDTLNQSMIIQGYVALLQEQALSEEQQKLLRKVERSAKAIQRQMEFTRTYQAIGSHPPLYQSVADCVDKAQNSLPLAQLAIEAKDLNCIVRADPMFEKVVYNLIDNCLRHSGGATLLRISAQEGKEGRLEIVFEDNGQGISADAKEHLFEAGYGRNTGYGLFLAKEVLSITNISIAENGSAGARFVLTVPAGDWMAA